MVKTFSIILFYGLLFSCAQVEEKRSPLLENSLNSSALTDHKKNLSKNENVGEGSGVREVPLELWTQVTEIEISRGQVEVLDFPTDLPDGEHTVKCSHQNHMAYAKDGRLTLYVSLSYFQKAGVSFDCTLNGKGLLKITSKDYPYKKERLYVDKSKVVYSKKDLARINREKESRNWINVDRLQLEGL